MTSGTIRQLLLGVALALALACVSAPFRHKALQPRTAQACVKNDAWSLAIVEVKIREALIDRLRLETGQRRCATLTRLPEEVHYRVRLLASATWTTSETVLVQTGQTVLLEIGQRPEVPQLWVSIR